MRMESPQFFDFNQMLVASVLAHCLALTFAMFLPQAKLIQKKIQPVFMVNLVEILSPQEAVTVPKSKVEKEIQKSKATPPPLATSKTPSPVKKEAATKVVETPPVVTPTPFLPLAEGKEHLKSKKLVQKLEQLAKLDNGTPLPLKIPEKKFPDETLQELEALKTPNQLEPKKKTDDSMKMAEALKGFEELTMEEMTAPKKIKPAPSGTAVTSDLSLEELEFEKLSEEKIKTGPAETLQTPQEELLAELEVLQKQAPAKVVVSKKETSPVEPVFQGDSTAVIMQKLASLKTSGLEVSIDVGPATALKSEEFKSQLRKLPVSKLDATPPGSKTPPVTDAGLKPKPALEGKALKAEATALQKYVGAIQKIVGGHWGDPLGASKGQVAVSFHVFRAGNIGEPRLTKPSGDAQLDRLALRAVKDSKFPAFPPELTEPNLYITFKFNYEKAEQ